MAEFERALIRDVSGRHRAGQEARRVQGPPALADRRAGPQLRAQEAAGCRRPSWRGSTGSTATRCTGTWLLTGPNRVPSTRRRFSHDWGPDRTRPPRFAGAPTLAGGAGGSSRGSVEKGLPDRALPQVERHTMLRLKDLAKFGFGLTIDELHELLNGF